MRPETMGRARPGANETGPETSQTQRLPGSVPADGDMPGQLDLLEEARRLRDDGQRAAALNTYVPARDAARDAIRALASQGVPFTADDVLDQLAGLDPLGSVGAFGALFTAAARAGEIVPVGFARSRKPSAHGRWVRTWRGLP